MPPKVSRESYPEDGMPSSEDETIYVQIDDPTNTFGSQILPMLETLKYAIHSPKIALKMAPEDRYVFTLED